MKTLSGGGPAIVRRIGLGSVAGLLSLAAAGCGRPALPPGEEGKDYRQMLERARARNRGEQSLRTVRAGIQNFQVNVGRLPTNLVEVVRFGYLKEIPELPEGFGYRYSPVLGHVEVAPLEEPQP